MTSKIYRKTTFKTAKLAHYKDTNRPVIIIRFPFNTKTLEQIRTLPNRKYNPDAKYWTCPVCNTNIEQLQKFGFALDDELKEMLNSKEPVKTKIIQPIEIKGLQLYNFQKIGVSFIEQQNGRALIADEMGLGKTVEALAWLQLHPDKIPVIIVTPASLKLNWNREAQRWLSNPFVQIINGTKTAGIKLLGKIIIINYDILPYWVERLKALQPVIMICDECHYFKNNQAKRTRAVKQLAKNIPHLLCLSGTPIVNRPVEIFNAIQLINPNLFSNRWYFLNRYCGAKYNGFGWEFKGATNTKELHDILINSIMIRRLKRDVLKELPPKTHSFIPVELENANEYKKAENNFIQYIKETKGKTAANKAQNAEILTRIETLKQVAVKNKLKQVINWINDFLESDEKLVIFAIHKFVIEALINEFSRIAVKVDGSVSGVTRQKAVDEFQTNKAIRLFIGNIQAAGIGITLTASSNIVILELPWTPGELTQAEDRCHRIGQENKVNIYYLLANNTIEEEIAALLDEKRKVLDNVLDGKDTEEQSLLTQLINKY